MFTQKFIKIFHSVQEIGLFSFFQNLALGKAMTNDKCHFATSWTRCRQYQCLCKIVSKYSKRFKSYLHFSRTGRWQNLHKLSSDKIKCLIIGHTMKVNRQLQVTSITSFRYLVPPTEGEGRNIVLVRIPSALASWLFIVCTLSPEPIGGVWPNLHRHIIGREERSD